MPLEGSRGAKLAELQEALKRAEFEKNTLVTTRITAEIEKLKQEDEAGWQAAFEEAARLELEAGFIAKKQNLAQIEAHITAYKKQLEDLSTMPRGTSTAEATQNIVSLVRTNLEQYKLALQIAQRQATEIIEKKKTEDKQAAEAMQAKKNELFYPALFYLNWKKYLGRPAANFPSDEIKVSKLEKEALQHLKEMVDSPSFTLDRKDIKDLKDQVISLLTSKTLKKYHTAKEKFFLAVEMKEVPLFQYVVSLMD